MDDNFQIYDYDQKIIVQTYQLKHELLFPFRLSDLFIRKKENMIQVCNLNSFNRPVISIIGKKIENVSILRDSNERFLIYENEEYEITFYDLFRRKKLFSYESNFDFDKIKITRNFDFLIGMNEKNIEVYSLPKFKNIFKIPLNHSYSPDLSYLSTDNSKLYLISSELGARFYEISLDYLRIGKYKSIETQTRPSTTFELENFINDSMGKKVSDRIKKKPKLINSKKDLFL
jgi:hypothetical protein